jgi:hypothetical protein
MHFEYLPISLKTHGHPDGVKALKPLMRTFQFYNNKKALLFSGNAFR